MMTSKNNVDGIASFILMKKPKKKKQIYKLQINRTVENLKRKI